MGFAIQRGNLDSPLEGPIFVLRSPLLVLVAPWLAVSLFVLVSGYFLSVPCESTRFRTGCCVATFVAWSLCVYVSRIGW